MSGPVFDYWREEGPDEKGHTGIRMGAKARHSGVTINFRRALINSDSVNERGLIWLFAYVDSEFSLEFSVEIPWKGNEKPWRIFLSGLKSRVPTPKSWSLTDMVEIVTSIRLALAMWPYAHSASVPHHLQFTNIERIAENFSEPGALAQLNLAAHPRTH